MRVKRRTPLGWHNFMHNKARAASSLTGVCFTMVLIFMQLGFYDAAFRSSTLLLDQLDFDLALVSPQYLYLRTTGSFPRRRLAQAEAVPGVTRAVPLYIGLGNYRQPDTGQELEILILAIDPRQPTFRLPELLEKAPQLRIADTALMDTKAHPSYGRVTAGTVTELENRAVTIVDTYAHGSGFISDAVVIVSDSTLGHVFPDFTREDVSIGLVKLQPGVSDTTVAALQAALPQDVRVMRRADLEAQEQSFFMHVKPLGLMFSGGVLLACVIGAVVLYQIQSSEVVNYIREYATLKAIGYTDGFLTRVVLQQAACYAVFGFVLAALAAHGLYALTRLGTNLPVFMTGQRLVLVLVLAVVLCSISGLLVSRKVRRADPAELY
jgi:putative ABC transport system permease protein